MNQIRLKMNNNSKDSLIAKIFLKLNKIKTKIFFILHKMSIKISKLNFFKSNQTLDMNKVSSFSKINIEKIITKINKIIFK